MVSLVHESKGTRSETLTDSAGRYFFSRLAPGAYELTAQMEGFRTERRRGMTLSVGQQAVLNVTLEVGEVATEAVVTASANLVDTQTTALSAVMEPKAIRELPLNGRDFAQLALLEPGVAPSRRTSDSGGPGTKLVINGNHPSQVSFVLDGSDINDANNNTPGSAAGVLLGVDTLEEFRVLTNSYSAAYGRSAGGVISAVTKSGTNQLHGSVFEFVRNSAFDAKNFFDGAKIPPFRRNQFGVAVDGPIVRNRTFFLASLRRARASASASPAAPSCRTHARSKHPSGDAVVTAVPGSRSRCPTTAASVTAPASTSPPRRRPPTRTSSPAASIIASPTTRRCSCAITFDNATVGDSRRDPAGAGRQQSRATTTSPPKSRRS